MAITHGTKSGYEHHACRCTDCREAVRLYYRAYRERRKAQLATDTTLRHGTELAYRYGCRCTPCKTAKSASLRASRARTPRSNP